MTEPDAKAPTDRDAPAEAAAVLERYARRQDEDWRYHPLNPAARLAWQERQAAVAQMLRRQGCVDTARLRLTEVGCGAGGMLLDMLQLGFDPRHLCGIELIPQRLARARERLPQALRLIGGDATLAPVEPGSQDIVLQSTVFSSLLDD
ncbi:MAG: class I SAM-dependent methyltransferase, partial [Burkholderiales bacterium]|nr:class I SAM-dependent methyltransferase [Burkholderiales bacterium]